MFNLTSINPLIQIKLPLDHCKVCNSGKLSYVNKKFQEKYLDRTFFIEFNAIISCNNCNYLIYDQVAYDLAYEKECRKIHKTLGETYIRKYINENCNSANDVIYWVQQGFSDYVNESHLQFLKLQS